jgi:hypothetical protein
MFGNLRYKRFMGRGFDLGNNGLRERFEHVKIGLLTPTLSFPLGGRRRGRTTGECAACSRPQRERGIPLDFLCGWV